MIKVDNLVNSNQEMQDGLTELTVQEMSEMKGGYAIDITANTRNPILAAIASSEVIGRSPIEPGLLDRQVELGVPRPVVARGAIAAAANGLLYTGPVTAAKLG
jgi:hypothetical protein